ncbi:MAG: ACT domain-containing protein [Clostridiales bacterium]|nr:ACT domain-containing protein [Clostridiales bacterium]
MRAFITVIGDDKIGIIHGVTSVLKKNRVNILDIHQTLLQEYFAMMMLVDLKEMPIGFQELKDDLVEVGKELGVSIKLQHEDIFKAMHTI